MKKIVAAVAVLAVAALVIGQAIGSTRSHEAGKPIVIGFAIGETGFIQPYSVKPLSKTKTVFLACCSAVLPPATAPAS